MNLNIESKEVKVNEIDANYWQKCIQHVVKTESNYWKSDNISDNNCEQFIIEFQSNSELNSENLDPNLDNS